MFFQWGRNVGWRASIYPFGAAPTDPRQGGNAGWNATNAPLWHWNPTTRQWVAGGWDNTIPEYPYWLDENDPCRHIHPIDAWRMPTDAELRHLGAVARGREFARTFVYSEAAGMGCWQGTWLGTNSGNPIYLPTTSMRNGVVNGALYANFTLRFYLWGKETFDSATAAGGTTLRIMLSHAFVPPMIHNNTTQYDRRRGHNVRCVRID